jgi:hypothetical protein
LKQGKQRYECKGCGCHYTRSTPPGYSVEVKREALLWYLEGVSLRGIERRMGISHVTVMKWVREWGAKVAELAPATPARVVVMELDELCHYVGEKNTRCGSGWHMTVWGGGSLPSKPVAVAEPLP